MLFQIYRVFVHHFLANRTFFPVWLPWLHTLSTCLQRSRVLAKLGRDCTPFGLSLTVKGRTEVRITLYPPIFPNRLLAAADFVVFLSKFTLFTVSYLQVIFITSKSVFEMINHLFVFEWRQMFSVFYVIQQEQYYKNIYV